MIGLSILSGSHRELIPAVIEALRDAGVQAPVVVGGIIPEQDVEPLKRRRRGRRLHAQGLRHHAHHARHRGAGRAPATGAANGAAVNGSPPTRRGVSERRARPWARACASAT